MSHFIGRILSLKTVNEFILKQEALLQASLTAHSEDLDVCYIVFKHFFGKISGLVLKAFPMILARKFKVILRSVFNRIADFAH